MSTGPAMLIQATNFCPKLPYIPAGVVFKCIGKDKTWFHYQLVYRYMNHSTTVPSNNRTRSSGKYVVGIPTSCFPPEVHYNNIYMHNNHRKVPSLKALVLAKSWQHWSC